MWMRNNWRPTITRMAVVNPVIHRHRRWSALISAYQARVVRRRFRCRRRWRRYRHQWALVVAKTVVMRYMVVAATAPAPSDNMEDQTAVPAAPHCATNGRLRSNTHWMHCRAAACATKISTQNDRAAATMCRISVTTVDRLNCRASIRHRRAYAAIASIWI